MDKRQEVEITLDFPIQLADRTLDKVMIRRPVMRDMIKHNVTVNMTMQETVNLIADLCGLSPADLEDMDTCDFEKVQAQALSFRRSA